MAKVRSVNTKEMMINAPINKRLIAFAIDLGIILFFILTPFNKLFQSMIPDNISFTEIFSYTQTNAAIASKINMMSIFMIIPVLLYFILLDYFVGQTVGKKLMNIAVMSELGELTLWQCILRNIVVLPFFPFIILWVVEPIYLFTQGRRLLERLSKTRTVQRALVIKGLF